jgi:EAL domain-containing protein (putative c-di-GMP-specific phosphodiesterase class I)
MDDFGTGYSSLSCLHQFPLDGLKIDRTFINNISEQRNYVAVVHAIIDLARNLGMRLIAEGIETQDQVVMLQALDCEMAQGYYFDKPRDVKGAEAFINKTLTTRFPISGQNQPMPVLGAA